MIVTIFGHRLLEIIIKKLILGLFFGMRQFLKTKDFVYTPKVL